MKLTGWLRICFINLLLVSLLGVLMRYKIAFPLPLLLQKNVLHSHSHFAFDGWVSLALMTLLVHYLSGTGIENAFKKYSTILVMHLLVAYAMLVSFILQGYGLYSIIFSTASIFISYIFAWMYWQDLRKTRDRSISQSWFKAALAFNVFSSIGAFTLAILMANKIANQNLYLSSIYFFLHFQYNGWFFFACMGLLFNLPVLAESPSAKNIFRLFLYACVPAYFLSVLWATIHPAIYWTVVAAAVAQAVGWFFFTRLILKTRRQLKHSLHKSSHWILGLCFLACSIKIFLQLFSVIPSLSKLAFGFRPIVIGYLHLVLLGVITSFILGYIFSLSLIKTSKKMFAGVAVFIAGIYINEIFLMMQGAAAMTTNVVPYINELLLLAALVLFTGLFLFNIFHHGETGTINYPVEHSSGKKFRKEKLLEVELFSRINRHTNSYVNQL